MTPPHNASSGRSGQLLDPQTEFSELFGEARSKVYGIVLTIVGDRDDAQDVLQDVAVVLWRRFGDFDRTQDFGRWASGVARNVARDFCRCRRRKRGYGLSDEALRSLAEVRHGASELLELRSEQLTRCLSELDDADRAVFLECHAGAVKPSEVAKRRKIPASTLYTTLSRLRIRLFRCVNRHLGAASEGRQ